jgi:hypothetical protein
MLPLCIKNPTIPVCHSRLETLLMHITSARNIWQKPSFTMVKQITYPTQKVEHLLISDRQGKCNHSSSVYLNQQKVSSSIVATQINPFTSHTTPKHKQYSTWIQPGLQTYTTGLDHYNFQDLQAAHTPCISRLHAKAEQTCIVASWMILI